MLRQPTHGIPVDRVGILRFCQLARHAVQRVEVIRRIDVNPGNHLFPPIAHKAKALHHIRIEMRAAYSVQASVRVGEVQLFLFLDHCLNHRMVSLDSDCQAGGNILIVLKSNESLVIQQR